MTGKPNDQHVADRIAHFAKSGFACVVVWDDELKDEVAVLAKIQSVTGEEN